VEDNAETSRWNSLVVSFEISGGPRYYILGVPLPLVMEDAGQMYTYQGGEILTARCKCVCVCVPVMDLMLAVGRWQLKPVGVSLMRVHAT
jgi:hypothetical protein